MTIITEFSLSGDIVLKEKKLPRQELLGKLEF
jgi:hypothetical protein